MNSFLQLCPKCNNNSKMSKDKDIISSIANVDIIRQLILKIIFMNINNLILLVKMHLRLSVKTLYMEMSIFLIIL